MELFLPVKPTILLVDDTPANLSLLAGLLHESFTVKAVVDGEAALAIVRQDPPDLILLDILLPKLDGYEICRLIKADPVSSRIPIIFITSEANLESEQRGMQLGAIDFITRPVNPPILLSRINAHFQAATAAQKLRVSNEYLEYEVAKRARQLLALQDVTILALASLAETRDFETGKHLRRTQHYVRALANQLCKHPLFAAYLTVDTIETLFKCAPLHDIGKVGIPDRILLKPGRYEAAEFEIMKTHPVLGRDAIEGATTDSEVNNSFLNAAKEIIYSHHEKWDGTGYPQGLKGNAIPIAARLMAVADVYDALISRRPYKDGMPHEQAARIILDGREKHFDPDVVDAFVAQQFEFQSIAARFADTDEDLQKKSEELALRL